MSSRPKHPIHDPQVQEAIERWTEKVLDRAESATIEVTLEFDVKDGRFRGLRLGAVSSQIRFESQDLTARRA